MLPVKWTFSIHRGSVPGPTHPLQIPKTADAGVCRGAGLCLHNNISYDGSFGGCKRPTTLFTASPLYQMIGPIQKTSTAQPEANSRSFPFLLVEWAMGLSMPWNPTQMWSDVASGHILEALWGTISASMDSSCMWQLPVSASLPSFPPPHLTWENDIAASFLGPLHFPGSWILNH